MHYNDDVNRHSTILSEDKLCTQIHKNCFANCFYEPNIHDGQKQPHLCITETTVMSEAGAPTGLKNVDAQPVGSGASLREMISNTDNYFTIG